VTTVFRGDVNAGQPYPALAIGRLGERSAPDGKRRVGVSDRAESCTAHDSREDRLDVRRISVGVVRRQPVVVGAVGERGDRRTERQRDTAQIGGHHDGFLLAGPPVRSGAESIGEEKQGRQAAVTEPLAYPFDGARVEAGNRPRTTERQS
jgi:hypothetical protein